MSEEKTQLFRLGTVVSTQGALEAFKTTGEDPLEFLQRHVRGDWGDLDDHDKQENELSVKQGFRILSAYHLSDGTKVWIITEADRSYSTFLLPEEYLHEATRCVLERRGGATGR